MHVSLVTAAVSSLLAGFVGSLHCFGMCGPLACAAANRAAPGRGRLASAAAWQASRIAAYGLVGAVLGGFGGRAAGLLDIATSPWLPWALALLLVVSALPGSARIGSLPGFGPARSRLVQLGAKIAPTAGAGVLGLLTPLLPCGLLYGALGAAIIAGSVGRGALVTIFFGFGAIPALALAQLQSAWIRHLPAAWEPLMRRGLPLLAAGVLVWRALHSAPESCCPH